MWKNQKIKITSLLISSSFQLLPIIFHELWVNMFWNGFALLTHCKISLTVIRDHGQLGPRQVGQSLGKLSPHFETSRIEMSLSLLRFYQPKWKDIMIIIINYYKWTVYFENVVGKQCRNVSEDYILNRLIWIYLVCKSRRSCLIRI